MFTCPKCRKRILEFLNLLRHSGKRDLLKFYQREYLIRMRQGKWAVEHDFNRVTVYCRLPDISDPGMLCCYHLSREERHRFFSSGKAIGETEKLIMEDFFKMQGTDQERIKSLAMKYNKSGLTIKKMVCYIKS